MHLEPELCLALCSHSPMLHQELALESGSPFLLSAGEPPASELYCSLTPSYPEVVLR